MLRILYSFTRLPRLSTRVLKPHTCVPIRCQATYPLYPPGVEIELDPEDESYDQITIGDEMFRRKHSYFSWLCFPKPKRNEELYAKQHEMLLEWRTLTQFTKPPVYPELDFYKEWFDLMIQCDMHEEVIHFYTLSVDDQLDIVFDDELIEMIESYMEGARARSYHNWERM